MTPKGVSEHSPSAGAIQAAKEIISLVNSGQPRLRTSEVAHIVEDCTHAGELLAALEEIMSSTPHSMCHDAEAWAKGEAAIRKARGEL